MATIWLQMVISGYKWLSVVIIGVFMVIGAHMWLPVATSGHICATLSNTLVNVKFREI